MREQMSVLEWMIELFQAHEIYDINQLYGAAELKIDDTWYIAANGHDEAVEVEPQGMMAVLLQPYHFAVWYNGFLAGLLDPYGGTFAAGSGANEQTFCDAAASHLAALAAVREEQ